MKLGRAAKGQRETERDRLIWLERHLHCSPASMAEDLEMLLSHIRANKDADMALKIEAFL